MSNETNKPVETQELTEKELEGVVGGRRVIMEQKESDADWAERPPMV